MPKLWSALGPTQANQQQIDTADQEGSSKFVTLKREKPEQETPNDKQGNHGWVEEDQTTHFQSYTQAPRPCKRQIETPSSISQKP